MIISTLVPQKSLFTASSFCRPFSSMKRKGNGGKRSRRGREPALSARTCRGSAPKTSSRAALASPLHPPFAERPGRIKLSHPAICSNTNGVSCKHLSSPSSHFRYRRATVAACPNTKSSVVLLSFSHHRGKKSNIILFSSFLAIISAQLSAAHGVNKM